MYVLQIVLKVGVFKFETLSTKVPLPSNSKLLVLLSVRLVDLVYYYFSGT